MEKYYILCYKNQGIHWYPCHPTFLWNSIFLVEFSGNVGRNSFLTSTVSQKIFRPYFQKSRLEYYFLCLFYFSSPYSGHFKSNFVVLLLLLTARSRRTIKADQKCPEKQAKKSKWDMKIFWIDMKSHLWIFVYKEDKSRNPKLKGFFTFADCSKPTDLNKK